MKNPLHDKIFLRNLDLHHNHNIHAKIIVLDFNENPKEEITGRVTGGSISVDGTSVVRRTCSLTMVAKDLNMSNYIWGLNSKFKLEIGLENEIDEKYPKIIWFKQGIFLITSYNISTSLNNYTISIQGKDKMSLLNGDIGGVITQIGVDFAGIYEVEYSGATATTVRKKFPIKDIVLNAVHDWAREPWHNIVVNDLDDYGLELLEYQGDNPLYLFITKNAVDTTSGAREVKQMYFEKDDVDVYFEGFPNTVFKIRDLENAEIGGTYDPLLDDSTIGKDFQSVASRVCLVGDETNAAYTVFKAEKGSVVGYRLTDITYAGELILNVGSTLTQMLDKLVQMLGNFEYFYDVDGRFIFQKKKTYVDVSWNSINGEHNFSTETYTNNALQTSREVYRFEDDYLISSFQNTPNLSNLKNDFSVWGVQEEAGSSVPIHIRYAIDHRPLMYRIIGYSDLVDYDDESQSLIYKKISYKYQGSFSPKKSGIPTEEKERFIEGNFYIKTELGDYIIPDWRSDDIYSHPFAYYIAEEEDTGQDYNLVFLASSDVPYKKQEEKDIVFVVDWREIIYQMAMDYRAHVQEDDFLQRVAQNNLMENGVSYYPTGWTGYEQYYQDFEMASRHKVQASAKTSGGFPINQQKIISYWREIYNPCLAIKDHFLSKTDPIWRNTYKYNSLGWREDIQDNPQAIHFWFDFLDSYGEINRYSIPNIGTRSKAVNDNKVKAIYYREIPNVIYRMSSEDIDKESLKEQNWVKPGYVYLQVSDDKMGWFTMSAQGKSAIDVLKEWLSDYTYCTESVSFSSTIPIYYLEPNTVALIKDNDTGVSGYYVIKQFTIPLDPKGQMSLTATKLMNSSNSLVGESNPLDMTTVIDTSPSQQNLLEVQNPEFIISVKEDSETKDGILYITQGKNEPEKDRDIRIAVKEKDGQEGLPEEEKEYILYIDNANRGDKEAEASIKLDEIIKEYFENEKKG